MSQNLQQPEQPQPQPQQLQQQRKEHPPRQPCHLHHQHNRKRRHQRYHLQRRSRQQSQQRHHTCTPLATHRHSLAVVLLHRIERNRIILLFPPGSTRMLQVRDQGAVQPTSITDKLTVGIYPTFKTMCSSMACRSTSSPVNDGSRTVHTKLGWPHFLCRVHVVSAADLRLVLHEPTAPTHCQRNLCLAAFLSELSFSAFLEPSMMNHRASTCAILRYFSSGCTVASCASCRGQRALAEYFQPCLEPLVGKKKGYQRVKALHGRWEERCRKAGRSSRRRRACSVEQRSSQTALPSCLLVRRVVNPDDCWTHVRKVSG